MDEKVKQDVSLPSRQDRERLSWQPERFVAAMKPRERLLVILRQELYEDSWRKMLRDLRRRMQGRPCIFKLDHDIQEDLAAAAFLKTYEERHGLDLAEYHLD